MLTEYILFEWDDLGDGVQQIVYVGKAPFGTNQSDSKWEIKKFTYVQESDSKYYVTQIKTLDGKAWTDRATYDWS